MALRLAANELFECDTQLTAKTAEAINNLHRYESAKERLNECDSIRERLAVDLTASQIVNGKLASENKNLRTEKRNLLWVFGASAILNMVFLVTIIRQ